MTVAVRTVLRGISQVLFVRSALTGALLVIALALYSPHLAGLVVLGAAVQSAAAWLSGHREMTLEGLMGYNGALVGAAAGLSVARVDDDALSIQFTIVGAMACIPLHLVLQRLFLARPLRRFGLPVSTAPFCTVAGLLFGVLQPIIEPGAPVTTSPEAVTGTGLALFNSFAEVMLADGLITGALILVALLIGSWRIGIWAVVGSVLALVVGLLVTGDMTRVSTGLIGYSAVLVAIALGTVFAPGRPLMQRIVCVVLGVLLAVALRWVLDPTPIPTYTWPFLLAMWLVLIGRGLLTRDPARSQERAGAREQVAS